MTLAKPFPYIFFPDQCCRVHADAQRGEIARVLERWLEIGWDTERMEEERQDFLDWLLKKDTPGAARVEQIAEGVR